MYPILSCRYLFRTLSFSVCTTFSKVYFGLLIFLSLFFVACENKDRPKTDTIDLPEEKAVVVPDFLADSAYRYIDEQVTFGPRIPNSTAHSDCAEYLVGKLRYFGAKVQVQEFEAKAFDGTVLNLQNIIAHINPSAKKRILLAAHWDSRPFADKDTERKTEPIDGANDGASGVGVLLEVARCTAKLQPLENIGVDLIFFDGEDYAEPEGYEGPYPEGKPYPEGDKVYWCLGSQYWSRNKHKKGYSAYYGILLDMVGAKGAQFHMEGLSMQYAPKVMKKVWDTGNTLGYGQFFIYQQHNGILDDHQFINEYAKIPTIDIVHYDPSLGYFGDYHHTHRDALEIIDRKTLKAVGQTLLHVLYNE